MRRFLRMGLLGTSLLTAVATSTQASAQDSSPDAVAEGTIVITARSRNETLIDVPLAISVVTSDKLKALDIRDTSTLANYVPGLEFNNYSPGYARNDRGAYRVLSFRGLAIGGAASLFLDGAAVAGNEIPASMDIGQVEVLRGPQSVYFGRSTMTGAVSYRTRPISDKFTGEFEAQYAERNATVLQGTLAGPIIPDLLKARLTGLYERSDGYVRNTYDNSMLGDRSRRSVSGTLELTPAPNLNFRAYVNYFRDKDGVAATAFLPASLNNCSYPGAVAGHTYFCGEVPGRTNSINYINTSVPSDIANFIFSNPLTKGSGFSAEVGGQRKAFNSHIVGTWEASDYLTVKSITAYHDMLAQAASDDIKRPVTSTSLYRANYYNLINKSRDYSQELRLVSDPDRALSWTLGANYLNIRGQGGVRSGFLNNATGILTQFDQGIGTNTTETVGIFGGVYYKLTDALRITGEARYQWDKQSTLSLRPNGTTAFSDSKTFKSFSPRISLDYDIGGNKTVYLSFARGNRPGGFNANIAQYADRADVMEQIRQLLGNASPYIEEERLSIGELGFKGNVAGGRGYFDLNLYYGELKNQQVTFIALIPLLGAGVTATSNAGSTEIYGAEWSGSFDFTREISLSTTFAWNHSKRKEFINGAGTGDFGTTDFSGKKFANVPEFSGSAVLAYNQKSDREWNLFSNASLIYRGKQYVDAFNSAYIDGRFQVDARVGITNGSYTIEAFVRNLFNDDNWTGGSIAPDYGSLTYNGFYGSYAEPRQFGGRFRVSF